MIDAVQQRPLSPEFIRAAEGIAKLYQQEYVQLTNGLHNAAFEEAATIAVEAVRDQIERKWNLVIRSLLTPDQYPAALEWMKAKVASWERETDQTVRYARGPEATMQEYLRVTEHMLHAARSDRAVRSLDGSDAERGKQMARTLWATMKNARIFSFDRNIYIQTHLEVDRYTTEKISKLSWHPPKELVGGVKPNKDGLTDGRMSTAIPKEEIQQHMDRIHEAGMRVPFPEPLPFDACYIGFERGLVLQKHQWAIRIQSDPGEPSKVMAASLLGYLVWQTHEGGFAAEIIQVVEAEDNYILPFMVCYRNGWLDAYITMAPWIVTNLVNLINEHRTIIVEKRPGLKERRDFEKAAKRLKVKDMIPRPYYVVRLEKKLVEETTRTNHRRLSKIARELSYRYDRRGHERCYIRRGKLPLEEKERKKLVDAGYKIWTADEPDAQAYRQLMERRQPPKSADEWLAILTVWIDPSVCGPEHLPYIPAIRVPSIQPGVQ